MSDNKEKLAFCYKYYEDLQENNKLDHEYRCTYLVKDTTNGEICGAHHLNHPFRPDGLLDHLFREMAKEAFEKG